MNTFQNPLARSAFRFAVSVGIIFCFAQTPLRAQNGPTPLMQIGRDAFASRQVSGAAKDANALPHAPALAEQAADALLRADPRLQRKVTLDELGTPLGDLLDKLSTDKLTLKADADCREFKLQIRLKQRPLYVLLQSLAQLYDGYWQERSDKQGYRFAQRLQTVRRRDAWWRLYTEERDKALGKISADVVGDMRRPVKARDPNAPEYQKEPGDPEREAMTARSHNAFGQFAGTLQQRIAQSFDPIYTCDMDGFQGYAPQEGGAVARLRDLPPDAQKIVQQHVGSLFADANPLIHFSNTGSYIDSQLVRPGGEWASTGLQIGGIRRPDALAMAVCSVNHAQLAKILPPNPAPPKETRSTPNAQAGRAAYPEEWQQLAAWQRSRVWPNDAGRLEPGRYTSYARRVDRLERLARQTDIEYVSDCYARSARRLDDKERVQPLTRPLKDELDAIAQEQDVSWKRNADALYLFRNNRWYRDDALEVPNAYARALLARCVPLFMNPQFEKPAQDDGKMGDFAPAWVAAQLELESEVVSHLSPWQIANGLKWYRLEDGIMPVQLPVGHLQPPKQGASPPNVAVPHPRIWCPFEEFAHVLTDHHRLLHFYGGLDVEQRDALTRGRLAWSGLTQGQQEQIAVFAPAVVIECAQAAPAESLLGIHVYPSTAITLKANEALPFFMPGVLELYTTNASAPLPPVLQP